ncbi:MAG: formate/nitrite transporter family protein [Planctomycetota bacterium]
MTNQHSSDAYAPREIASRVESMGVAKAQASTPTLLALAVLAGAFISLGGLFYLVVVTQSELGLGITRLLGGISFSLGLILVVVGGAELFTGNNLLAMAWASGLIDLRAVLRNWALVYVGNVLGCLATVAFVVLSGVGSLGGDAVLQKAVAVATSKTDLSLSEAFARGVLCNALVCLAVWLAMGGRSVTDKVLGVVFPVAAFVAIGLEHSIANWFFLPLGIALGGAEAVSLTGAVWNLTAVTAGNIIGGTLLVASVYWVAYLRGTKHEADTRAKESK